MFNFSNKESGGVLDDDAQEKLRKQMNIEKEIELLSKQLQNKASKLFKVNEKVEYMGAEFYVSDIIVPEPAFYLAENTLGYIKEIDVKKDAVVTIEMFSHGVHHKLEVSPNKLIKIKESK